ncbi:MAG: hypothetical protein SGJ26_10280 [Nitrospirota bacterium]|nr:hypothetical protein [Nitrospirota bacterium]
MNQWFGRRQCHIIKSPGKAFLAHVMVMTAVAWACSSGFVQAESSKFGAYSGTITVSGTHIDPQVSYRASVKVSLPVTQRDSRSATAEFFSGEAPTATVLLSQWDESFKEKFEDSDGKFRSWTCSLAAPIEVPMMPTGVLNVDLKGKKHALSITLLSTKEVAFNCMHSRSGAYKKKQGVSLYIGTGTPGMQDETQLPFSDAARLNASYTLMPTADTKGQLGPIIQEWDLRLAR